MPALLTQTSSEPGALGDLGRGRRQASASVTSSFSDQAPEPIASAARSAASPSMSLTATV